MGVYFIWCSHEEKEYIKPEQVNGGGIKDWATTFGGSARLAAYLASRRWSSTYRVSDCWDDYTDIREAYTDITEEAIADFNRDYLGDDETPEPIEPLLKHNPPCPKPDSSTSSVT